LIASRAALNPLAALPSGLGASNQAGAADIGNLRKRCELLQSSQERGNILLDGIFGLF